MNHSYAHGVAICPTEAELHILKVKQIGCVYKTPFCKFGHICTYNNIMYIDDEVLIGQQVIVWVLNLVKLCSLLTDGTWEKLGE